MGRRLQAMKGKFRVEGAAACTPPSRVPSRWTSQCPGDSVSGMQERWEGSETALVSRVPRL